MSGPIAASFHIWATYALVVLAIASYVTERFRAEITSLVVLVALVLLFELVPMAPLPGRQRLDTGLLLAGFANPALIAVMALLVLGQGPIAGRRA